MRKLSIIALGSIIVLGICVSGIKYQTVFLRKKLNKINNEIVKATDDLRVFGAEWSCLNEPKRLSKLASKYLPEMCPVEHKQVLRYNDFINTEYETQTNVKRQAFDNLLDSLIQ